MPKTQSQRALARRAAPSTRANSEAGRGRLALNTGLAALAVSVLSIGLVASAPNISAAEELHLANTQIELIAPTGLADSTPPQTRRTSRSAARDSLATQTRHSATERSVQAGPATTATGELTAAAESTSGLAGESPKPAASATPTSTATPSTTTPPSTSTPDSKSSTPSAKLVRDRAKLLAKQRDAAERRDTKLKKRRADEKRRAEAARRALGTPTLPVHSYRLVARFGDTGAWARYHTGMDFSAPVGTTIYAPLAGTVEHAGTGGKAGGWAGNYVVVRHADGTQTLYAHMSSISVNVGQHVRGGSVLGRIGQTGRAFGPHLHFEVYRPGAEPGDVYSASNPQPWLSHLHLHP